MAWTIELAPGAVKALKKMDKQRAGAIAAYLREVATLENPRSRGKALVGSKLGGLWRYRVEDYRIICQIQDGRLWVLVLDIGRRDGIYK